MPSPSPVPVSPLNYIPVVTNDSKHLHFHEDGPVCSGCEQKLTQANPVLAKWFHTVVKPAYPFMHISWSFRDQANQNACVANGTSKLPWPQSAHNNVVSGVPAANALDLFEQVNGKLVYNAAHLKAVADMSANLSGVKLLWGGQWPSLGDKDHFQVA